jgi:hypothetical protein
MNDLFLHTIEEGRCQIQLAAKDETVWLTQLKMAEHFAAINTQKKGLMQQLFPSPEVVNA